MIEGRSIVCFAHDWGGDPTSKTHIMRILSERNRILWVNSIGMRRPTASARDVRRILHKLRRAFDGCRELEPNLWVTNPIVLPLPASRIATWLNSRLLAGGLRRLCRRHGLRQPILWTFLPNLGHQIGRLDERLVIYHCVDEYSAFSGVPRKALVRMERDLVSRADLVFTSSEQLCAERRPLNRNTHHVPHGVDVEHFATALDPLTPVAEEIRRLPRPVIGFFGLIADWVDLELVRSIALARPSWSIVLVGKAATDLGPIRGLPNVHCVGQKPYGMLPRYCRGFDVGVIPFRVNELTLRASPLKLREYLAAGLPVVSTPLPEVERYDDLVHLAPDPEGFLQAIGDALATRTPQTDRRRMAAVGEEGWRMRVETMCRFIEDAGS